MSAADQLCASLRTRISLARIMRMRPRAYMHILAAHARIYNNV